MSTFRRPAEETALSTSRERRRGAGHGCAERLDPAVADFDPEVAVQHRATQIAIDEQGSPAMRSEDRGEIARRETLAVSGHAAGADDRLGKRFGRMNVDRAVNSAVTLGETVVFVESIHVRALDLAQTFDRLDRAEECFAEIFFDVRDRFDARVEESKGKRN